MSLDPLVGAQNGYGQLQREVKVNPTVSPPRRMLCHFHRTNYRLQQLKPRSMTAS